MRLVLGIIGLFLLSNTLTAQSVSLSETIGRLGDRHFTVREAAQAELLRGDLAAIPLLEMLLQKTDDAEVGERVELILAELRRLQTSQSYLKASTVALNFNKTPLKAAVAELEKLTQIRMVLQDFPGMESRLVTVTSEPLPMWEAIELFRVRAGLAERFFAEPPATPTNDGKALEAKRQIYSAYRINNVPEQTVPPLIWVGQVPADDATKNLSVFYAGCARVSSLPGQFEHNRRVRGTGAVIVSLDVVTPSHLRWSEVGGVRISRAEDETGRTLFASDMPMTPPQMRSVEEVLFLNNGMVINRNGNTSYYGGSFGPKPSNPRIVSFPIRTGDRESKVLTHLEGTLCGQVTLPNEVILDVPQLSKSALMSYALPGEVTLNIAQAKEDDKGHFLLTLKMSGPNPWNRNLLPNNGRRAFVSLWDEGGYGSPTLKQFRFLDKQGRTIPPGQVIATSTGANGMSQSYELTIRFSKRMDADFPEQLKVIGERIVSLDIPFKLRNVMLP